MTKQTTKVSKPEAEAKQDKLTVEIKKHLETLPTKSAKIRYLDNNVFTRSEIAKVLDIRYQHVRNVLEMPVKNPKK